MQIYRYPPIRYIVFLICVAVVILLIPTRGAAVELAVGDTLAISRSLPTTFHRWELYNFEENFFELIKTPDPLEDPARFEFKAAESGAETFQLRLYRKTNFIEEVEDTETINLSAYIPEEEPAEEEEPALEEEPAPEPSLAYRREINELLDLERFETARELINEQLAETTNEGEERWWMDKLAESYLQAEEYEEAIEIRKQMIERFSDISPAGWMYKIARAHRANDEDGEAELVLLRIRHQHRNTVWWPEAIQKLAEIAIDQENYERAANLLEELKDAYRRPVPGQLLFQLARLYDKFETVRDYRQAVDYYQLAARRLAEDEPEKAEQAAERANYLVDNYVEFGM